MVVSKQNPVGIDAQIHKLQQLLNTKLLSKWSLNDNLYVCYGRCYRNQTKDGYAPEFFLDADNDYQDVLLNDKVIASSFFGLGENSADPEYTQNVHLIFFVSDIKFRATSGRADEEIRLDVYEVLQRNRYGFKVLRIITGIDEVLREYPGARSMDKMKYRDMHPRHCFRFDLQIIFNPLDNSCAQSLG